MPSGSPLPFVLAAYTFTTVLGAASGAAVPLAVLWVLVVVVVHSRPHAWSELGVRVSLATSGGAAGVYLGMVINRSTSVIGGCRHLHAGWPVQAYVGPQYVVPDGERSTLAEFHVPDHFYGPHIEDSAACALNFLCCFAAMILATAWLPAERLRAAVPFAGRLSAAGLVAVMIFGPPLAIGW